jgi:hypothetical protein
MAERYRLLLESPLQTVEYVFDASNGQAAIIRKLCDAEHRGRQSLAAAHSRFCHSFSRQSEVANGPICGQIDPARL